MVDTAELQANIDRIIGDMDKVQLAAMEKVPLGYAAKIEGLLTQHYREIFAQ